jgi:hypothetical protein
MGTKKLKKARHAQIARDITNQFRSKDARDFLFLFQGNLYAKVIVQEYKRSHEEADIKMFNFTGEVTW